jgi:cytochrome c5
MMAVGLLACQAPAPRQDAGSQQGARPAAAQAPAQSDQQRRLFAAAMIALPPEGLTPESLPAPQSRGAQLLNAYCTQCHALPSPAMHGAQDWPSVARRMWVRIDMMHGELGVNVPGSGDRVALLNYLLANALKVADHLRPGPGRDVFEATCSRCHLLPDPQQHSSPDWPAVVMRMERNMERMKVSGVTNQQAQTIITYLETASRR